VVLEPPAASPTTPSGQHLEPWPAVPGSPVAPVAMTLPGRPAAPVLPAGVTEGELDLPLAASELAWWKAGAGLDSGIGTVVLAGHVDTAADGLGYLAALATVDIGAVIDLRGEDGVTRHYRVTGRRSYDKEQGLPASVFDQRVQPRLAVITCAGRFEPATRSYQSNLVVYAVPAGSRPAG
jgi:Sortase domain